MDYAATPSSRWLPDGVEIDLGTAGCSSTQASTGGNQQVDAQGAIKVRRWDAGEDDRAQGRARGARHRGALWRTTSRRCRGRRGLFFHIAVAKAISDVVGQDARVWETHLVVVPCLADRSLGRPWRGGEVARDPRLSFRRFTSEAPPAAAGGHLAGGARRVRSLGYGPRRRRGGPSSSMRSARSTISSLQKGR